MHGSLLICATVLPCELSVVYPDTESSLTGGVTRICSPKLRVIYEVDLHGPSSQDLQSF